MNKDDLILISVDDHIAEPADMFDAHVPAKYKHLAPRVVIEPDGVQPLFDVAEAAREVKRLADKGCHAVTFSENPEALQMPSIHTKYWYPLFEAVCENKTVLCTHVGSASRSPMVSTDAPPSVMMT